MTKSYSCTVHKIFTGDNGIKQQCSWYLSYSKLHIVIRNPEENRQFRRLILLLGKCY